MDLQKFANAIARKETEATQEPSVINGEVVPSDALSRTQRTRSRVSACVDVYVTKLQNWR